MKLAAQRFMARPPYLLIAVAALAIAASACDESDGDDAAMQPSEDGSASSPLDGGREGGANEAGPDIDTGMPKPDPAGSPAPGPGDEPDADVGCRIDMECDDSLVCNGSERCVAGECLPALTVPSCTLAHPCREETKGCDCRNPNMDGDAFEDGMCVPGGEDCDDGNPAINPLGTEVCDLFGVDEDCNGETFTNPKDAHDGDADADGFFAQTCFNIDRKSGLVWTHPKTLVKSIGDDCDDQERTIHPMATEACDHRDNDCDSWVDEKFGEMVHEGLFVTFYEDRDGDGFGSTAVTMRSCPQDKPFGYVSDGGDCEDDPAKQGAKSHPNGLELCDGIDNNCRNGTDAADSSLLIPEEFENTTLECTQGKTVITECPDDLMWCDKSTVSKGCEQDITRLSSCRDCETQCRFACGATGCEELVQLSVGQNHSCGATSEGRAVCWGRGAYGRLGLDNTSASFIPREVVVIEEVAKVSAGEEFTCAIAGEQKVVHCWGLNDRQQLGNPDGGDFSTVPVEVTGVFAPELSQAVDVAAGTKHACAVLSDGSAVCWGEAKNGRLGDGPVDEGTSDPVLAVRMVTLPGNIVVRGEIDDAVAVVAGNRHTCIINLDQEVECWGANDQGQLGADGSQLTESGTAVKVSIPEPVDQIAAGVNYTCARAAGAVYCWGGNGDGQLGRPSGSDHHVPTPVAGLDDIVAIAAGNATTCAVSDAGALHCWGSNSYGQLGTSDPSFTSEPIENSLTDVVEGAVDAHACARTRAGQVYCWGDNDYGSWGNGKRAQEAQPKATPVKPLAGSVP